VLIILSFLILSFKKFIVVAMELTHRTVLFRALSDIIVSNARMLTELSLFMGGIMLLLIAFRIAHKTDIRKNSLMGIIHESGKHPTAVSRFLLRALVLFLVLNAFYIVVFDYAIEWLAVVIDSSLVMLLLVIYAFHIIRHHRKADMEKMLFRIGNFGERFYESFIELFHDRKRIWHAISGLLVLHMLIDIVTFVIPSIFSFARPLYFEMLDPGTHKGIFVLMSQQIAVCPIAVIVTYALNVIAMVSLLLLPAYIWRRASSGKGSFPEKMNMAAVGLFFAAVAALAVSPVYVISRFRMADLVGVDIMTVVASRPIAAFLIAAGVFFAVLVSARHLLFRVLFRYLAVLVPIFFVVSYAYNYFLSYLEYFVFAIPALFAGAHHIAACYLLLFMTITLLFYIAGIVVFAVMALRQME
jgi:hypothetical protein